MGAVPATAYLALCAWSLLLAMIDLRIRRLPNALTLPGAIVIVAVATLGGRGAVAAAGAALLAVPYLLVHIVGPAACGAGDVKLALGTGAAAACGGAQCWTWAALGAPLLTAAAAAALLIRRRVVRGPRAGARHGPRAPVTVPHGPSMCLATLVALWPAW
ncbi:MAG: prepilin peptidase [Nocardia sp.]|nr:prepilin peptidase [Nocardia sp.]